MKRSALVFCFLLWAGATVARAQTANPDSALAQQLRAIEGQVLALDEAMRLAVEHATEVREAEAQVRAAEGVLRSQRGVFDPSLFADADKSREEWPKSSSFSETEHEATIFNVGAEADLRTGGHVRAGVQSSRDGTDQPFSYGTTYTARGRLDVVQPLLAGFGPAARRDLTAAEHGLVAARAAADATRLAVESRTERVYWQLYAAERDYAAERILRDGGDALLEEARKKASAGLVGPNQVANARVFLAERSAALLDVEERMDRLSDELATLLGTRPEGAPRFRPVNEPPHDFPPQPADAMVEVAMQKNPGLQVYIERVEIAKAVARGARWDALPTLDFVGSLGGNGLTANGRQPVTFGSDSTFLNVQGDYGDAWSDVMKREFPTWSAGLRLTWPIGMREQGGEHDRARAQVLVVEQQLEAARRSLDVDVRTGVRELQHARERVELAAEGAEASVDQVRIGRLEYQAGRTTAFELVRLAGDLATAQRRYSQALVRAATAAATLRELTAGAYPPASN